jgi:hypothetical protein
MPTSTSYRSHSHRRSGSGGSGEVIGGVAAAWPSVSQSFRCARGRRANSLMGRSRSSRKRGGTGGVQPNRAIVAVWRCHAATCAKALILLLGDVHVQEVIVTSQSDDELLAIDAYWRAANYLTVGQIYLLANPLLREPLRREHIKPRLLGHWGTSPGLSLIYAHVNRIIRKEGTTTTPFDMVGLNETSRYHLAIDAIRRCRRALPNAQALIDACLEMLARHAAHVAQHLEDLPEIRDWTWTDR